MKKLIQIFLFTVLISCDTELPAEIPPFQSEIVVNSIIRSDTSISVVLSNSISILSYDIPTLLEGASINLFENDVLIGELKDTVLYPEENQLFYIPNAAPIDKLVGIYYMAYAPKNGIPYRLEIAHPDYPPAIVTTQIPEKTSDFEIVLNEPTVEWYDLNSSGEQVPGGMRYRPTIKIKDAPKTNYYEIAVIGESPEELRQYNDQGDVISTQNIKHLYEVYFTSDDIVFDEVSKPELLDGRNEFEGENGIVFSDLLFENQEYSFEIDFIVPVGARTNRNGVLGDFYRRFFIEIRSLSEDYYQYKRTVEIQESNIDDPFAEPTQIHTNVQGGLGIFAGYNVELFEFSLEEFISEE